jgi:hypothetical protein
MCSIPLADKPRDEAGGTMATSPMAATRIVRGGHSSHE